MKPSLTVRVSPQPRSFGGGRGPAQFSHAGQDDRHHVCGKTPSTWCLVPAYRPVERLTFARGPTRGPGYAGSQSSPVAAPPAGNGWHATASGMVSLPAIRLTVVRGLDLDETCLSMLVIRLLQESGRVL